MIKLSDLDCYEVIAPRNRFLDQETYCFITGDAEDPCARVIEITFYQKARSVEFADVTDLHREKYS